MPYTNLTFVNGSTNFKTSAIAEEGSIDNHKRATEAKENKQATIAGKPIPMRKITLEVPADSVISSGLKKMEVKEKQALTKLHDVVYHIALKGRSFKDSKDLIGLEKLHGVKFQSGEYENETSCRDFIDSISKFLFKDNFYKKLLRVNFIAILCDGTTDASITEQEVVYVFFVDPDTMEPTLTFFKCLRLEDSQDANGIFEATKKAFEKRDLLALLDKLILLSSDGAFVNSSKKSGLISLFREERER